MNEFEIVCENESATCALGGQMGRLLTQPTTLFLTGTLGAGKTRLVQAMAGGLGINPDTVNSPTFTIMIPHPGRMTLLHVDAYRIKDLDEADQLGIDDWVEDGCVLVVEWAEKIEQILPPPDLRIKIEHRSETVRSFHFMAGSDYGNRIVKNLNASD